MAKSLKYFKGLKVEFPFKNKWNKWMKKDKFGDILQERIVQKGIIRLVRRGISPIKDHGRFTAYSADRRSGEVPRQRLYPYTVQSKYPSKQKRPVNLYLSGKYLDRIQTKRKARGIYKIGLMSPTNKQRKMFDCHNLGNHPDVPQRKHLPTENQDRLKEEIMIEFRKGLAKEFK